jgi:putative sterol carrier protein
MTMGEATTDFMEGLSRRGHEPLLETTTGTIRVELVKNGKPSERWLVSIDKGDIHVSHKGGKTDCTFRVPEELFDGMASGEVNPFAALLRGQVFVDGETRLLARFQKLFPSPPRKAPRTSRKPGGGRKR